MSTHHHHSPRARAPPRARPRRAPRAHASHARDASHARGRRTFIFATGNGGKLARAREHVRDCCDVESFDDDAAFELQLPTVRDVALDKARRAHAAWRRRVARDGDGMYSSCEGVLAHDCGFAVKALNGFPGPYTKDFNYKVGGGGLLKLLVGDDVDRAASWDETLVCVTWEGEEFVFSREGEYDGEVAREAPSKWTRWRDVPERSVGAMFVPTKFGFHECLADVSEDDYQRYRRDSSSVWNDFAQRVRQGPLG